MQVIMEDFVLVYEEIRFFIVTGILYTRPTNQYQFGKISHLRHKQLGSEELLFMNLAKSQYTRDHEGLYFCIKVDQYK